MQVDEPIPGPPMTLYRGASSNTRWRAIKGGGRPLPLTDPDILDVVFVFAEEVGANANIVLTLKRSDGSIVVEEEDPSYFRTSLTPANTAALVKASYWYGAFLYRAEGPEVLLLPALVTMKPLIGPPEFVPMIGPPGIAP